MKIPRVGLAVIVPPAMRGNFIFLGPPVSVPLWVAPCCSLLLWGRVKEKNVRPCNRAEVTSPYIFLFLLDTRLITSEVPEGGGGHEP